MSIYDTLNDCQKEAVFHTEGPLLILAGAGSGKTRVLTHRICYLIEELGVNPWNILAITFTNKAAGEMRERVDRVVSMGADNVWVSTFHSTCVRILRRYIDRIGYDTNFTIYDTDDQKSVIKEVCKKFNIDTKMLKERVIMSAISSAKDELTTPEIMEKNAANDYNMRRIAQVYKEYQRILKQSNALDFDDLIVKTVELFKTNADVLESYQERFRYIMVDEYQDTNTAQFKLISLLADRYKNLCVVGDDDQSIYKFRGANIGNILNFEDTYPGAKVIKLEQNYRSTQTILDAANGVIKNNFGRKDKSLWTDNEAGEKITFTLYDDAYREADGIVNDIKAKVRDGWNYNDFAILYRTNAQSRSLEEKFVVNNVPYRVFGGVNFYQRKEIKDILAYLKTIDNGRDSQAAKRIINVPKRGIGATTIERVQQFADESGDTFFGALENAEYIPTLGRGAAKIKPFVLYMEVLRAKKAHVTVQELVEGILEDIHYMEYLAESDTPEEVEQRQENIDEFINKIVSYQESCEDGRGTLSGFLEEVALVADIDNLDESNEKVMLMTLHSAKGLEFPIVYMPGLEDGLFPGYMSITSDDKSDLEEERRLCYVGITRAKKELKISAAKLRMIRGETQANKVSRFVKEIPKELLETANTSSGYSKSRISFGGDDDDIGSSDKSYKNKTKQAMSRYSSSGNGSVGFGKAFPMDIFEIKKPPINTHDGSGNGALVEGGVSGSKAGTSGGSTGLGYEIGDNVKHVKFGIGKITSIVDAGRDYEVTVDFGERGIRKMFASFARLRRV